MSSTIKDSNLRVYHATNEDIKNTTKLNTHLGPLGGTDLDKSAVMVFDLKEDDLAELNTTNEQSL